MRFFKAAIPAALVLSVSLSGCALDKLVPNNPSEQSSEASSASSSWSFNTNYGRDALPTPFKGASPTVGGGIKALAGGLWLVDRNHMVLLRQTNGKLTQSAGHVLLSGLNIERRVVNGAMQPMAAPTSAKAVDDNTVELAYPHGLRVRVALQALNVSGLRIADFLRSYANEPLEAAKAAGDATFPKGALAFLPVYTFCADEIFVPTDAMFIPSKTVPELLSSYAGNAPYCMAGEVRGGNRLIGMVIDPSSALHKVTSTKAPVVKSKKPRTKVVTKIVTDRRGRKRKVWVKVPVTEPPFAWPATQGPLHIIDVDPSHVLCHRLPKGESHQGTWETSFKNGTNIVTIHFDSPVDARDMGMPLYEQKAATLAFAEVKDKGMQAARVYTANKPVYDYRYRFNTLAAKAITKATGVK